MHRFVIYFDIMLKSFKSFELETQQHPELTAFLPFDVVWEYKRNPMKYFQADIHYALQISIVLFGKVEMIFDDCRKTYSAGDIFFTTCWEPHAYRLSAPKTFLMSINLNIDTLGQCAPFSNCDFMLPFATAAAYRVSPTADNDRRFFLESGKKIFHYYCKKPKNYHYHAWLLIHQLLLHIIDMMPEERQELTYNQQDFKRVKNAVDLVRKTQGKAPSLEEAASICNLSVSRFSALFKHSIGISYGQFALHARLSKVAEELLYSNYSLNELAERWGFFDASSLSHAFNKVFNCRPGAFKKQKELSKNSPK